MEAHNFTSIVRLAGIVDRCDWLWLRDIVVEVEALEAEEVAGGGADGWNVKGARFGFRLVERSRVDNRCCEQHGASGRRRRPVRLTGHGRACELGVAWVTMPTAVKTEAERAAWCKGAMRLRC
ncbi:hypothetical protein PspLS_12055 [Pyricularia sp. CBS 133598]|nr:hypothetical protein PspLS_12055 [Pyricularia sp. CBS 133598]